MYPYRDVPSAPLLDGASKRQPQVAEQVARQTEMVEHLVKSCMELRQRLEPLLSPEPGDEAAQRIGVNGLVPLAQRLAENNEKIRMALDIIALLPGRLEL